MKRYLFLVIALTLCFCTLSYGWPYGGWGTGGGGSGSGDVTKVGTPVDEQVGVWTGDGTLAGYANFTFDGDVLGVPVVEIAATANGGGFTASSEDTDNGSDYFGWGAAAAITNSLIIDGPTTNPAARQLMIFAVPSSVTRSDNVARNTSQASWYTLAEPVAWAIHDDDVDTAVANGKKGFPVPAYMNGWELTAATGTVRDLNSATGGATTYQIRRVRGDVEVDMLSTPVTVSYNEYHASDGVVNTVGDVHVLATGDMIYIDVDSVTTGAVQKGDSFVAVFEMR